MIQGTSVAELVRRARSAVGAAARRVYKPRSRFERFEDSVRRSTWEDHDANLNWALERSRQEPSEPGSSSASPLVALGWTLKQRCEAEFRGRHLRTGNRKLRRAGGRDRQNLSQHPRVRLGGSAALPGMGEHRRQAPFSAGNGGLHALCKGPQFFMRWVLCHRGSRRQRYSSYRARQRVSGH